MPFASLVLIITADRRQTFEALLAQLCYRKQTVCVRYWIYEIHTTSYVVACICGSSEMNKYYSTSGHRVPWEKNRDLSCCCLQQHQNKCNTRCPDIWRNRHGAIKLQLGRSTWERNESSVTIVELRFQAELITWRASNNQLNRQQTVHLKR